MGISAEQIASFVKGRVVGDPEVTVNGFSQIDEGRREHISFLANPKYLHFLDHTEASVVIVSENLVDPDKQYLPTLILVEDGYLAFQVLMNMYQSLQKKREGIEQPAFVSDSAKIGNSVYVGAFAYVGDQVEIGEGSQIFPQVYLGNHVKIGKNCQIDSGVKIYDHCVIGDNCIIHSNSVIGGDGFGFQPGDKGFSKIPQLGNVVLENDVEVGSNCSIDRATIGSTLIGEGTKLDNLLQIGHNVKIGKNNVIAAQAGIAGSTTVGDWNMIGGQAGLVGHIHIGNQVKIQAQSGVNGDVKDGEVLYGSPAMPAGDFRRSYVYFRKFPEVIERISKLEELNSKK